MDGTWHRPDATFIPGAELVWSFEYPLATGTTEPSLGASGTHYAVNSGHTLYAIDSLGSELLSPPQDEFLGLPDVDPLEEQLLIPTSGTTTYPAAILATSTANGTLLWGMEFPGDDSGLNQFTGSRTAFSFDGHTAYMTTAFAGGGNAYLNAIDTNPTLPSTSTVLQSSAIEMSSKRRLGRVNVTGAVAATDENRSAVSGVSVSAIWLLPDGTAVEQVSETSGTGIAKFTVSGGQGLYRWIVNDISQVEYRFDPLHGILEGSGFGS